MLNTVVRQIAFYTFERKVHLERKNGELTADKVASFGGSWRFIIGSIRVDY
jgi:oligoendopeptidase F